MNLAEGEDSPWGDQPGNSPRATSPPIAVSAETEPSNPETPSNSQHLAAPAAGSSASSRSGRGASRTARTQQTTRLEALDDDLGPLGPLGGSLAAPEPADEPPELPQKERTPARSPRPSTATSQSSRGKGRFPGVDDSSESLPNRGRAPPQPDPFHSGSPSSQRSGHPSVSVEQAARPTFNISVGDPHKVGDLTGSHTAYQVRTRTTSKAYHVPEFEVSRRYKDFLWLYNQLHISNPGIIVPPPPEKQAVGRFEANFVESRRAAMERMLNKIAAHPILQHDGDLKIFLESDAFSVDVKQREKRDPDMPVESKGVFSGLNISSGSGGGGKFIEHDDWFLDRRVYLDTMEGQLKALLKSTDVAISQRRGLAESATELATALNNLAQVEISPTLTGPLASLSDVYVRVRELYDRQAQQDVLTLGITIDEYIRLIGSIKKAFEQRQRTWHGWHNAESDLQKRRSALDKLLRQGRSQQDKVSQLQADVGDAERRAHQARLQFEDIGRGMRQELERFEKEKVEDFRMGVETFLEASVEAQKELIELWETFLAQLDQDDEERQAGVQNGQPLPAQPVTAHPPAENSTEASQPPVPDTDSNTQVSAAS